MLSIYAISSCLLLVYSCVTASEPFDPVCQTANEYLNAMYRCRHNEFQVVSFCATGPAHDLNCQNKTYRIAVYSASVARSEADLCSQSETFVSPGSVSHTDSDSASECCLLPAVETKCQGRSRCALNSVELMKTVDGRSCPAKSQRPTLRISVVFICVTQKIWKEVKRDATSPDGFCDGHLEATRINPSTSHGLHPLDVVQQNHSPTSSPSNVFKTSNSIISEITISTNGNSSDVSEDETSTVVHYKGNSVIDWFWTYYFIRENMDRFLIYLFLSIAVGVILVLFVVILGLCFGRYFKKRKLVSHDHKHRMQSSTQTTDVTTSLLPSNNTQGVEMVHYAHSDSLHALPVTSTGTGNSVRFSPDGKTYHGLNNKQSEDTTTFSRNGSATIRSLNLPHYQINNASKDSVDSGGGGGGQVTENDDYRSSTLGRFYTNPYRHDSYRSDGYRTLQHK